MNPKDLIKESYQQLHEWSKWLVTIETAICAALWPKLTESPNSPFFLYLGWLMFVGSIISASGFLILLAFFVQRIEKPNNKDNSIVKLLVSTEYGFFFLGILCFIIRLTLFKVGL